MHDNTLNERMMQMNRALRQKPLRLTLQMLPLGLFGAGGLWFGWIEENIPPLYNIFSPLDELIPFLPIMVIPYISWYLYIAAPLCYFYFKSRKDFFRLASLLATGMLLSCVIFIFFPSGQNLRPDFITEDGGICSWIIYHIYSIDTPTNCMPSMHVMFSLFVHFVIKTCDKYKENKRVLNISLIWTIIICASTVFVKQHSILDVAGGIVVGMIINYFIGEKALESKPIELVSE
jgi:membrane-associated phospholipid phosphatase